MKGAVLAIPPPEEAYAKRVRQKPFVDKQDEADAKIRRVKEKSCSRCRHEWKLVTAIVDNSNKKPELIYITVNDCKIHTPVTQFSDDGGCERFSKKRLLQVIDTVDT